MLDVSRHWYRAVHGHISLVQVVLGLYTVYCTNVQYCACFQTLLSFDNVRLGLIAVVMSAVAIDK